jgi:hypothetical protein
LNVKIGSVTRAQIAAKTALKEQEKIDEKLPELKESLSRINSAYTELERLAKEYNASFERMIQIINMHI